MKKGKLELTIMILILVLGYFSGILIGIIISKPVIQPIEVYRGNTELEITEKVANGKVVEKDTVVVWKIRK